MRLCAFEAGARAGLGVVIGAEVADLRDAPIPASWPQALAGGSRALEAAQRAAERAPRLALDQVRLLPPLGRAVNVLAVGLNYADHARETGRAPPPVPSCFAKLPGSIAGPFDPVVRPAGVTTLDYEGELGLVMGADRRIAGYLVINDVTAREHVAPDRLILGKAADTFAPMGPYVTTADEAGAASGRSIRTWVDGELRQDGSTEDMVCKADAIVALLSRTLTLRPGDVIATGSPAGSGAGMKPPRFLQPGQTVEVEIEGLGRIANRVVDAAEEGAPR